jgi:Putative abortive phage resistance protein AbiGi, antitoxin
VSAIEQRYVSRDLTHFAGAGKETQEEQYDVLLQILRSGELRRDPKYAPGTRGISGITRHRFASFSRRTMYDFPGVCFCNIPLADLEIHVRKYSCFGIAFQKPFLLERGASPVFYIANDSWINPAPLKELRIENRSYKRAEFFDLMVSAFNRLKLALAHNARAIPTGTDEPVGKLAECAMQMAELQTYLVEYVLSYGVPFDATLDDDHNKHFYMEREWRVLGDVVFQISDVERLVVPRQFGRRLRDDVPDFCGQVHFLDSEFSRQPTLT